MGNGNQESLPILISNGMEWNDCLFLFQFFLILGIGVKKEIN